MLHLIKIEWLKLKKYRAFLILSVLFIVSVVGANYVVQEITSASKSNNPLTMLVGKPFAFPNVWHTVSYVSSMLLFIPGLIIILLMSNEYSYRTHRQNIIDGLSRSQFIGAKIILVFIFSFVITLLVAGTATGFGLTAKGSAFMFTHFKYIPYLFIQSVMYLSVALLFVLFFKRSGLSIGVYFLYMFILEELLVGLCNKYLNKIGHYLPLESSDNLIPFPISLKAITGTTEAVNNEYYYLAASCVWIILILWFCRYWFMKKDL